MNYLYALLLVTAIMAGPMLSKADAFGTMTHVNLTADALREEGFSESAIKAANVFNFLVDLYAKGHYNTITTWIAEQLGVDDTVEDVEMLHFDSKTNLTNAEAINAAWVRLSRITSGLAGDALRDGDSLRALVVIGASLHTVQDFYSHTNWAEPRDSFPEGYGYGPGWKEMRLYGTHPTWYDAPLPTRLAADLHGPSQHAYNGTPHTRDHGDPEDGNEGLHEHMNKDMSDRPYYADAYVMAYFATRQWVRAIQELASRPSEWRQVQRYGPDSRIDLEYELGVDTLAFYTQGWDGCTDKSTDTAGALVAYAGLSPHRAAIHSLFQSIAAEMADGNRLGDELRVSSTQALQAHTEFARLAVVDLENIGGTMDYPLDEADMYAVLSTSGQRMKSYLLREQDAYDFTGEQCPAWTFIKATAKSQAEWPFSMNIIDDDAVTAPGNDDDSGDLSPAQGRRTLHMAYDKRTGGLSGDATGADGRLLVRGAGESNPVQIEALFDVITPLPPMHGLAALLTLL